MESAAAKRQKERVRAVDLTNDVCPISFVKAKLHMQRMEPGEEIEFILAPGEQIKNVPRSVKEEGHEILNVRREGDRYFLLVRKTH